MTAKRLKSKYDLLIKTTLGFEKIVAARIKELDPEAIVIPSPKGFKGLVLVKSGKFKREELLKLIEQNIVEADRIIPVEKVVKADLDEIVAAIEDVVKTKISDKETFAVRTVRRGRHSYTSIDVNVIVGEKVREITGAGVNLRFPDKIVLIEIIGDEALLTVLPGSFELHKITPEKKPLYSFFRKISVIQMPYLGPKDSIEIMGRRIGREVQNFEVRELVIAPIGIIDAEQLLLFIKSVFEGIRSRYEIQVKSYARKPYKVPVYIQDLHQLVRSRSNEVIIVFEPEGRYITDVVDELEELVLRRKKRVNLLFGSREGIPIGIYRYADLVIDIAPGITLSTDYAAAAGLIALATALYNRIEKNESNTFGGWERS